MRSTSILDEIQTPSSENKKLKRWSIARAVEWHSKLEWIVGCNFLPSSAVNQLEMWQESSYDPETIDRELSWAEELGFNCVRVYLHDLLWLQDREGFCSRIDHFLGMCLNRRLSVILVLFDDCHRPEPKLGKQPLPVYGVHNSGWVHSPGQKVVESFFDGTVSIVEEERLKDFVVGVLTRFSRDRRILMWDVYNEPGQSGNGNKTTNLLRLVWDWAQSVRPAQPMTSCLEGSIGLANVTLNSERSDIITFHLYQGATLDKTIFKYKKTFLGRPILCTEFMAREFGTTFLRSLPIFKRQQVGCISWGLVAGKSQTHFNWDTVTKLDRLREAGIFLNEGDPIPEPDVWFHDIFRTDGSAYDPTEVAFIRTSVRSSRKSIPVIKERRSSSLDSDNSLGESNFYDLVNMRSTATSAESAKGGEELGRTILNMLKSSSAKNESQSDKNNKLTPIMSKRLVVGDKRGRPGDWTNSVSELRSVATRWQTNLIGEKQLVSLSDLLGATDPPHSIPNLVGDTRVVQQVVTDSFRRHADKLVGAVGEEICQEVISSLVAEAKELTKEHVHKTIDSTIMSHFGNAFQSELVPALQARAVDFSASLSAAVSHYVVKDDQDSSEIARTEIRALRDRAEKLQQTIDRIRLARNSV